MRAGERVAELTTEQAGQSSALPSELPPSATPLASGVVPARKPSSERLANVERLRIVAMLEIVTFHVGGAASSGEYRLPLVGGLGLPVFLLLNNAFNCTLAERRGTRAFLDAKVSRLLVPWLVWSVLYAGLVVAERVRHGEPVEGAFSWRMILGGTYTHLWFVPFALFGSLLIAGLQQRTKQVSHQRMAALSWAGGSAVALLAALALQRWRAEWPLLQWLFALPSPLLGFALGRVLLSSDRRLLRGQALLLGVVGVVVVVAAASPVVPEMLRRYAVALALVGAFFTWPGSTDAVSRRLTPLLFGIYLAHPLFVRAYQAAHLPELSPAVLGVLVFAASAALVDLLRRTPLKSLV